MAQPAPAVASSSGLLYSLFNGSALADQGQSTVFIPPENASTQVIGFCNQITVTIANLGTNQFSLQGYATVPPTPMTGDTTGSWLSLVFPSSIYDAASLASFELTATQNGEPFPAGQWVAQATTASDPVHGNEATPVLVLYSTAALDIEEGTVITLTLSGVPPVTTTPTAAPQAGAFFWNEVNSLSSSNESRLFPQFWMAVDAPDPTQLTASMPLVTQWNPATFDAAAYGASFTSDQIGRTADSVYATLAGGGEVFNNLGLGLNFSTQAGPVAAGSGSTLNIGIIAADLVASAGAPFLGPTSGLVDSSNVGPNAALAVMSEGQGWQIGTPAVLDGFLYTWGITFSGPNIVSSLATSQVALQLEEFLSAMAADTSVSPPYATACVIWWTGIPGAVNGCITLPLMVLAPVPALTSLGFATPSPVPVKSTVTVNWTTYAAAAAALVQTSASQLTVTTPIPSTQTASGSLAVVANPFSGSDLNAEQLSFALSLTPYGGGDAVVSAPSTLGLEIPASPSLAFAGALAIDAANSTVTTTFTFVVPDNLGACEATAIGTGVAVTIVGGATGTLTTPVVGGAVNLTLLAPGGPYSIPNAEASTWSPYAPPAASTVLIFPYVPGAVSPEWPADLYVWQPGYPLRPLSALVKTSNYSPYSASWNNISFPAMTVWPANGATVPVTWPYGSSSTTEATVNITWSGGMPSFALAADTTLIGTANYSGANTGPLVTAGAALSNDPNGVCQAVCLANTPPFGSAWNQAGSSNWGNIYRLQPLSNAGLSQITHVRGIAYPFPGLSGFCSPFMLYGVYPGGMSIIAYLAIGGVLKLGNAVPSDIDTDAVNQRGIFSAATSGIWQLFTLEMSGADTFTATPLAVTVPCAPQNSRQQSLVPVSVGRQSATIFYVAGTLDGSKANPGATIGIACYSSADTSVALPLFTLPAADEPFIPTLIAVEAPPS